MPALKDPPVLQPTTSPLPTAITRTTAIVPPPPVSPVNRANRRKILERAHRSLSAALDEEQRDATGSSRPWWLV